jgi:hypothetical protein
MQFVHEVGYLNSNFPQYVVHLNGNCKYVSGIWSDENVKIQIPGGMPGGGCQGFDLIRALPFKSSDLNVQT